jgi:hypothetical protein
MTALLASPHLIDFILLLTAAEACALMLWRRKTGRGPRPAELLLLLAPGVCLMVALRAALAGVAWPWVPAALTAALVVHLADLRLRFTR